MDFQEQGQELRIFFYFTYNTDLNKLNVLEAFRCVSRACTYMCMHALQVCVCVCVCKQVFGVWRVRGVVD